MTNALDYVRTALATWRSRYGDATLHNQCQRFDGYYWQEAYQGNDDIAVYPSAQAAANASSMFTTWINDPKITAGDLLYWWYGSAGHVGTVVGFDNGRTLVSHTANTGDTVLGFTNNVKISHADTLDLSFRGASHTNGANRVRNVDPWYVNSGGGAPAGNDGQVVDLGNDNWYWYNNANDAENHWNVRGGNRGGGPMLSGPYPVNEISAGGAIRVRSQANGVVWLAPEARALITGSPAAPSTSTLALEGAWYWFDSAADAQAGNRPHGGKYDGEKMLVGTYPVLQIAPNGAIQVRANDGSGPWVNSLASEYLR